MVYSDDSKTVAVVEALISRRMEVNLMRPFITPNKTSAGKTLFPYQLEGLALTDLEMLCQRRLLAYELAGEQNFQQSWEFRLHFDGNISLEFSSACTEFQGWHEIGSLNILLWTRGNDTIDQSKWSCLEKALVVARIDKLVFEDDEVISECGISIFFGHRASIVIAAGNSPGSVSVKSDFSDQPFEPQFPVANCVAVPLTWCAH